eukprot:scaffold40657_cov54-Phaeocystis_antarctica.AAC.5
MSRSSKASASISVDTRRSAAGSSASAARACAARFLFSKPMTNLLHSASPTLPSSSSRMDSVSLGLRHLALRTSTLHMPALIEPKSSTSAASNAACCFAARLRVVDLLDAVGALQGLRIVPRLHQQHRVPDGADAVAEEDQIILDVVLPDNVVAHPEERVLRPQPLLLEELVEGVEQRFDRRVEEPAHEHGGLAHVRRPLRVQPLTHGQPVHRFPEGEEVLVDVAVLSVVLGVLGLAFLVERNLAHAGQRHAQPQVLGQRSHLLGQCGPLGKLRSLKLGPSLGPGLPPGRLALFLRAATSHLYRQFRWVSDELKKYQCTDNISTDGVALFMLVPRRHTVVTPPASGYGPPRVPAIRTMRVWSGSCVLRRDGLCSFLRKATAVRTWPQSPAWPPPQPQSHAPRPGASAVRGPVRSDAPCRAARVAGCLEGGATPAAATTLGRQPPQVGRLTIGLLLLALPRRASVVELGLDGAVDRPDSGFDPAVEAVCEL